MQHGISTITCRLLVAGSLGLVMFCTPAAAHPPDADGTHRGDHAHSPAATTAGPRADVATFRFSIRNESGALIPGRLTFMPVGADNARPDLFPNVKAKPKDLAVRRNLVYTLSGEGAITVPPGEYRVYASRGMEWSVDTVRVALQPQAEIAWNASLRHEVDTTGWISGDFHLHTLTYSGHGDADMDERIISIIGEGVEFAVATDHNHHTDYQPTIDELGGRDYVTAVTGNEVSTPVGHFNAFPLEPSDAPVEHRIGDAKTLFTMIRAQQNRFGITPVIQLNHPRWGGIDYFGQTRLDPVSAASASAEFSYDFDTIEVLNENVAWGYRNAEVGGPIATGSGKHSVLEDWFHLLNRGHRYAAVGNSDSHHVEEVIAGVPRNYMPSATDDPAAINAADVARRLRERNVFTTTGPFLTVRVNDQPLGSTVNALGRPVNVSLRIQAASWIDVDRVKFIFNGDVIREVPVPASREVERLNTTVELALPHDGWLAVIVEGDEPLAPIVHEAGRDVLPIAIANPVWIDQDGDGQWTSPAVRTRDIMLSGEFERMRASGRLATLGAHEQALVLENASVLGRAVAIPLIEAGLTSPDRVVRLTAAKVAESYGSPALLALLADALRAETTDRYAGALLLRALHATQPASFKRHLMAYVDRFGGTAPSRFSEEIAPLVPGRFVNTWLVAGYFPGGGRAPLDATFGPEDDSDVATTYTGKDNATVQWEPTFANERGYVTLRNLTESPRASEEAVVYAQVWINSPTVRDAPYTIGTDDGGQVILNGAVVYDNRRSGAADPLGHVGTLPLKGGWNQIMLKIENGRGEFGFYFRVMDDDLTWSVMPGQER